jgi:hypothetical protein
MHDLHDFVGDAFHFLDDLSAVTRMFLDLIEFGVGQPSGLGDDVDINAQLAEVMQQPAEPQGLELLFGQLTGTTNGEGQDRDVDRVSESIVVVVLEH